MRETRPSLAHRLAWLIPPVGIVIFAFVAVGPTPFGIGDPLNAWGRVAWFVYFVGYAAKLAMDAIVRKRI